MHKHKLLLVFISADDPLAKSSHIIKSIVIVKEDYTGSYIIKGTIYLELLT